MSTLDKFTDYSFSFFLSLLIFSTRDVTFFVITEKKVNFLLFLSVKENNGSSVQSGDSETTFWNTTPTFRTPPHRAPAQQREHKPARVGVLVQLFGTPGPPTRPRATLYMVRILVQPLEHQGNQPDRDSGPLFDESLGSPQKKSCLDYFSMRADQP